MEVLLAVITRSVAEEYLLVTKTSDHMHMNIYALCYNYIGSTVTCEFRLHKERLAVIRMSIGAYLCAHLKSEMM